MNIHFKVVVNKDGTEIYEGIQDNYKEGIGRIERWDGRIEIGEFKNNMKNGYFTEYSVMGPKDFDGYYINDKKHGLGTQYINGKKSYEGNFVNGLRQGKAKEYDFNTGVVNFNGQYNNGKRYDGIGKSSDFEHVDIEYSELMAEEKNEIFEDIRFEIEQEKELIEFLGDKVFSEGFIEEVIDKYLNDEELEEIFKNILSYVFQDDKKIMVERYVYNIEPYEYRRGLIMRNSRFDNYMDFLYYEDITEESISKVKDIYFRKDDIVKLLDKYIDLYGSKLFLNIDEFINLEYNVMLLVDKVGGYSLSEDYLKYIKDNNIYNIHLNVQSNLSDKLYMLIEIVNNKYKFQSKEESILVTWLLYYYKMVEYFSHEWEKEFEKYFENIVDKELDECIKMYLSLSGIDADDKWTKFKFNCFLMNHRKFINYEDGWLKEVYKGSGLSIEKINFSIISCYRILETRLFEKILMDNI